MHSAETHVHRQHSPAEHINIEQCICRAVVLDDLGGLVSRLSGFEKFSQSSLNFVWWCCGCVMVGTGCVVAKFFYKCIAVCVGTPQILEIRPQGFLWLEAEKIQHESTYSLLRSFKLVV
jgi:hypothetical protein